MRPVKHPHISPALRHLRNCTFVVMAAFAAAMLTQAGVFLFIHFTDAHTKILTLAEPSSTAVVHNSVPSPSVPMRNKATSTTTTTATSPATTTPRASQQGQPIAPPTDTLIVRGRVINIGQAATAESLDAARAGAINTVETPLGLRLRRIVGIAQTVGIIAAVGLCVLMLEGVAVGAAARVPGIHHIVSSTTWMLLIAGLTVPLAWLAPAIPWSGVFTGYDAMLDESTLLRDHHASAPSALVFYARHLLVPLCCLAGLAAVVLRYTAAVEEGIIVTHASQLDAKVEREIRSMGAGHAQMPRSVGALNAAISASEADEDEDAVPIAGPRAKKPMPRPI